MQIEYSKNSVKYINAADKPTKKRLKDAIEKIPFGDIKKLQGIDNGYREKMKYEQRNVKKFNRTGSGKRY